MYTQLELHTKPEFNRDLKEFAEEIIDNIVSDSLAGLSIDDYSVEFNENTNEPDTYHLHIDYKDEGETKEKDEEDIYFKTANELLLALCESFGFSVIAETMLALTECISINVREFKDKEDAEKNHWI